MNTTINISTTTATTLTNHIYPPSSPSISIQLMNDLDDWLAGPTDPGLGKPAGTAADMCHEYLLPIGSPRMALDDSTQTPMLRWQGCVKDDVFFAQAPADPFFLEDDIASLSSHASSITELLQRSVEGTPSDLLYDHEPLFDGIEEDLNQDQAHVVRTEPIRRNSTVSTDLDWSALLDELCDDDDENLKRKRPEEEDDVVEERICHLHLSDSTSSSEEEELIKTNRRIKRRKKSGLPCKKHTKKKSAPSPVIIEQAQDGLTLFENLTQAGIDWCRYCGTTEGVNWRPGPWGKRTLCNKHGCDYKGYGLASRLPRLDLSAYAHETLDDRDRPVVQQFCAICQRPENLVTCEGGCSRAYHSHCYSPAIDLPDNARWYCNEFCRENRRRNKVVVDLPRKYLPLMRLKSINKSSTD